VRDGCASSPFGLAASPEAAICREKPSNGLEPLTPSLPWPEWVLRPMRQGAGNRLFMRLFEHRSRVYGLFKPSRNLAGWSETGQVRAEIDSGNAHEFVAELVTGQCRGIARRKWEPEVGSPLHAPPPGGCPKSDMEPRQGGRL
jgi:hypothetical protein